MIVRTFTTFALLLPVLVAGDDFLKDYRRLRSREVKTASATHSERTLNAETAKPLEDAFFRLLGEDTSMTSPPARASTRPPTRAPTFAPSSTPGLPFFNGTIVDFVIATPTLSTLLAAVERAGLVEALSGTGPFTLFAPTNNAFTTVPTDVANLLFTNDEFIPHLRDLLLYHMLLDDFFTMELVASTLTTANAETIAISLNPLSVNGIAVSDGDNSVSNGVVHLIDTGVLTPSWVTNTLIDRVNSASDLSTLETLLVLAGIDLSVPGSFTLLAPTNTAFAALPQDTLDFLTDPTNVVALVRVLAYHIVMGVFTMAELTPGTLMTFGGNLVTVSLDPIRFNTAGVVELDILARNGVLHKIDEVLEPPSQVTPAPTSSPSSGPPVFDGTIVDFVIATPTLSTLLAAVVRAGLVEALRETGPFTLFAPTNDAFTTVPTDVVNLLFTNDEFIPHLRDLLLYHVLLGKLFAVDLVASTLTTANAETIAISLNPLSVNGIAVSDGDYTVSNGVVHLFDTGVLTPSWVTNTLIDRVNSASDLSTLETLLVLAGIDLSVPGSFTLLAPTNTAFAALPQDTLDFLTDPTNVVALVRVLAYHIVMGVFTMAELTPGTLMTFGGNLVTVTLDPIRFNTAEVVEVDILARNGVLHKIDEVLEPPSQLTITDFVIATPTLSTLLAAVVRAGLVEVLSGTGPFTLFAPTNNAFTAVPTDVVNLLFTNDEFIPHLRDLLLYHVLLGDFFAAELMTSTRTTANAEIIAISLNPLSVNGIAVSDGYYTVSNGVVHLIDTGVLTPSWVTNTLIDRVNSASDLSTLETLLVLAGIDLSIAGSFTLLAPTNTAFAALPQASLEFLTDPANVAALVGILAYHIIAGVFTVAELTPGTLTTFSGGMVTVSLDPIRFNTAEVVEVDILARNGVLHKIDEVLEPGS